MIRCAIMLKRPFRARDSSIQSGCTQCSRGIRPNEMGALVRTDTRLRTAVNMRATPINRYFTYCLNSSVKGSSLSSTQG